MNGDMELQIFDDITADECCEARSEGRRVGEGVWYA